MQLKLLEVPASSFAGPASRESTPRAHQEENRAEVGNGPLQLEVPRSCTVGVVRDCLSKLTSTPRGQIQVFFRGNKVNDGWHLGTSLPADECLIFTRDQPTGIHIVGLESLANLRTSSRKALQNLLEEIKAGMQSGVDPELAADGSGGTYFLRNTNCQKVACFKPADEEPSAPNNPRGITLAGLRDGVLPGEAVEREVAAFITDTDGFSGVPETIMVEIAHPAFNYQNKPMYAKKGSLQRFVRADCASDYAPHLFPVDEVHKIGILDLRLLNSDRNDANLLVSRVLKRQESHHVEPVNAAGSGRPTNRLRSCSLASSPTDFEYHLIPIDHGYCLPDRLQVSWCDLCWLDWPQSRQPFSERTKEWVRNYDVDANVDRLRRELNVREPCLRLVKISGMLLKMGVEAGLCLHDIASIYVRQDIDAPSVLEKQITRSIELANMMLRNARVRGINLALDSTTSANEVEEFKSASPELMPLSSSARQSLTRTRSRRLTISSTVLPEFNGEENGSAGGGSSTDSPLNFGPPVYEPSIVLKLPPKSRASSTSETDAGSARRSSTNSLDSSDQRRGVTPAVSSGESSSDEPYDSCSSEDDDEERCRSDDVGRRKIKLRTEEKEGQSRLPTRHFGGLLRINSGSDVLKNSFSTKPLAGQPSKPFHLPPSSAAAAAAAAAATSTASRPYPPKTTVKEPVSISNDKVCRAKRVFGLSAAGSSPLQMLVEASAGEPTGLNGVNPWNGAVSNAAMGNSRGSPAMSQAQAESRSELFERYFYEYIERLLGDVIMCIQSHRKSDTSLFRRSSSMHLTSPHRHLSLSCGGRRNSCESFSRFFGEDDLTSGSKRQQTQQRHPDERPQHSTSPGPGSPPKLFRAESLPETELPGLLARSDSMGAGLRCPKNCPAAPLHCLTRSNAEGLGGEELHHFRSIALGKPSPSAALREVAQAIDPPRSPSQSSSASSAA